MTLSLNVSLPALVSSFNGERSESECQAAIDAAWDALTVADLGVSLEYTAMGLQLRSHTVTVEETDEDEDINGNAVAQDVSYRWQAAISAAFGQIDLDNAAKVRPATVADLARYADATESDYNDGMSG